MDIEAIKRMPDAARRTGWEQGREPLESLKESGEKQMKTGDERHRGDVSRAELEQAVAEINHKLALHNTRLVFTVHDKTRAVQVRVVDTESGEIVREIPPKRVLDIRAMTLEELGLLVDEKA